MLFTNSTEYYAPHNTTYSISGSASIERTGNSLTCFCSQDIKISPFEYHDITIGLLTDGEEMYLRLFRNLIETMKACPVCHVYFKSVAQHVAQTSFCREILTAGKDGNHHLTQVHVTSNHGNPLNLPCDQPLGEDPHFYHEGGGSVDYSLDSAIREETGDEALNPLLSQNNQSTNEPVSPKKN
jgi:hypothetical protein